VAVRALTLPDPYVPPGLGLALLDLDSPAMPEDFPQRLLVAIPPSVRRHLNIPPDTVVEIRRRVRTRFVSELNQLIIPVTALVLAAVAVPLKWWEDVIGVVLVLLFGLAPMRIPKPPRGRWP
jgi:hypothetical protein